jgi:uncharacterized protein YdeI (YjbR/CyaY-like superfamily)
MDMLRSPLQSFTAVLEPDQTRLRWVIARLPFDASKAWPVRRGQRVRGTLAGFAFRTSLFPDPRGQGQILLVNKKMQTAAGASVGSEVRIELEPDLEERPATIPPELARALQGDRPLRKWYEALSLSMRREIGKWIEEPKTAASRTTRAERMAERLLQAKEGEVAPPPILQAAFQSQPQARTGWLAMTPTQRRNHLLGIFYYESVEARQRRADKAITEALLVAKKKSLAKTTSPLSPK